MKVSERARGWALKRGVHVIDGDTVAGEGEGVLEEGEGERVRGGGPHSLVSLIRPAEHAHHSPQDTD